MSERRPAKRRDDVFYSSRALACPVAYRYYLTVSQVGNAAGGATILVYQVTFFDGKNWKACMHGKSSLKRSKLLVMAGITLLVVFLGAQATQGALATGKTTKPDDGLFSKTTTRASFDASLLSTDQLIDRKST